MGEVLLYDREYYRVHVLHFGVTSAPGALSLALLTPSHPVSAPSPTPSLKKSSLTPSLNALWHTLSHTLASRTPSGFGRHGGRGQKEERPPYALCGHTGLRTMHLPCATHTAAPLGALRAQISTLSNSGNAGDACEERGRKDARLDVCV